MHVVVYGRIKLSFVSASAMEKVVDIISPGESFGEAVMFLEKPHVPVLSEPTTGDAWNERTGLVHEAILADFPDLSGCAIYACGSMQMIQTANKPAFLARGLPDDFCFSDVLKPQSMQIPT